MPSPATHLRAPLLWLLVPLMAGLTAARLWAPPTTGLWPLAMLAGLAAITAGTLAFRPGLIAGIFWALSLAASAGLGGFVLLQARHPALHLAESRPPREVSVTIRVTQTFPASPQARSLS